MLPAIDFDRLSLERPDLAGTWNALKNWFAEQSPELFFKVRQIATEVSVETMPLVEAIMVLQSQGLIRTIYRVEDVTGILPDNYSSPLEIPDHLLSSGSIVVGFAVLNATTGSDS